MSHSQFAQVLNRYRGRPALKLTLLTIAAEADPESGESRISFERIACAAGTSRRTTIRNVTRLLEKGVLEQVGPYTYRVQTTALRGEGQTP